MVSILFMDSKKKDRIILRYNWVNSSGVGGKPGNKKNGSGIYRFFFGLKRVVTLLYLMIYIFYPERFLCRDVFPDVGKNTYSFFKTVIHMIGMGKIEPCVEWCFLPVFNIFLIRRNNIPGGLYQEIKGIFFFAIYIQEAYSQFCPQIRIIRIF